MLLLPTLKDKPTKRSIPYGLIVLLIIQALIFFEVQLEDNKYQHQAINYYFQSQLHTIEFPMYVRFLRRFVANELYNEQLQKISDGNISEYEMYWFARYDPYFQNYLLTEQNLPESSLYYMKWQEKRREYLQLLSKDAQVSLGFKTAVPGEVSSIISLFLHGDGFQFAVNFVFLLLVGFLIERLVGVIGMLACYFLFSTLMLSIYCFLVPDSLVPFLGASGGVAGFVGMLSFLYGTQKARLYYGYFYRFRYIEILCVVLLPLWIAGQFALILTTSLNLINFIPQMVALLGGVLFGMIIKQMVNNHHTVTRTLGEEKNDDFQMRLHKAGIEITNLNYPQALIILNELLDEYPTNKEVHLEIFNIVKLKPASEAYHQIAQKIFCLNEPSRSTDAMINLVFNNYIRRAKPTIRFDIETFFTLLQRFRKAGYYEDSIKILQVLVKQSPDGRMSEVLARELLLLARAYLMKNDKVQANRLLTILTDLFPDTESAKQVKRIPVVK